MFTVVYFCFIDLRIIWALYCSLLSYSLRACAEAQLAAFAALSVLRAGTARALVSCMRCS